MALKRWIFRECDQSNVKTLMQQLGVSKLLASVLVTRGLKTPEQAEHYLGGGAEPADAFALADMQKVVDRIYAAVENGERIEIFGDYDVDGITSTALLFEYLESMGADVGAMLPTREGEGYGLNSEAVDEMAKNNASLIITVDNGVSSHEAIDYALSLGIETVVTDHHKTPDTLPNAVAVVDPLRPDDKSAFKELAGVGVVLKLLAALEGCEVSEIIETAGVLAALGTVSDAMPLLFENRYIVREGLAQLPYYEKPGLLALAKKAGFSDPAAVDSRAVAYSLAPRLNAAGRIGNADIALELLLTEDEDRAVELSERLDEMNAQRQQTEREMLELISDEISENPDILRNPILFFASERYNAGVAGIVCSRMVERYGRPTIILSVNGDNAKGSGRSIAGFSLYDAIKAGEQYLQRFGGHDMAAGFTILTKDIEALRAVLIESCKKGIKPKAYANFPIESVIEFADINEQSVNELTHLSPFGTGNDDPVFATLDAVVSDVSAINERHCRVQFKKNGASFSAALFGTPCSKFAFKPGDHVDIAYVLSIYRGARGNIVSSKLKAVRPAGLLDSSLESLTAYQGFFSLGDDRADAFAPSREDIARVYRHMQKQALPVDDIEFVCSCFFDMPLGRVYAALDILDELELIETTGDKGAVYMAAVENPEKTALENSDIFKRLNA